ncbi:MAG: ABC transporter permease [Flavobacteriales bacterium]|nr:ABC transporter permease [Flavobacteriales bacterium]
MGLARFIARRILADPERQDRLSRPIVLIAMVGVVLGMAVMVLTVGITRGFQHEIRAKVVGIGGHLQLTAIAQSDPKETPRMVYDPAQAEALRALPGVAHVQTYATKPGIVETEGDIEGVVVRGLGGDLDPTYLTRHLVEGRLPLLGAAERPNEVLISAYLADRMRIAVGDTITIYLVKDRDDIRPRKFTVTGTYRTGLEQVDHQLVVVDIGHLQRFAQWGLTAEILLDTVNQAVTVEGLAFGGDRDHFFEWSVPQWSGKGPHTVDAVLREELKGRALSLVVSDASGTMPDTAWLRFSPVDGLVQRGGGRGSHHHYVGGIEVDLTAFDRLDELEEVVHAQVLEPDQRLTTVRERSPEIFAWLELLDTNVAVVIVLMVVVAVINMTSALLLIILERTTMIGVLKALGATNGQVRRIFLLDGAYILGLGILGGDLLGIVLALVQRWTGWVRLPVESYYVDVVPVDLELWPILLLNAGTLMVCVAALVLPSMLVTRIAPARAIRFE